MKHARLVSTALMIGLEMALSACDPSLGSPSASTSLKIPTEFWNNVNRVIRLTTFPRAPGENRCQISEGGTHLPGVALTAGSCTTRSQRPSGADLHNVPASVRSQVMAQVTLSERWSAGESATFTFGINRHGKILTEHVTGQPPQLWK